MTEALNGISDDLLLEAAQMTKKKTSRTAKLLRVAAIAAALAILITAVAFWPAHEEPMEMGFFVIPGVIRVYAYDMAGGKTLEDMEKFELVDGGKVTSGCLIPGVSLVSYSHLPLTFEVDSSQFEGADILISVNLNYGSFWRENEEPKTDANKNNYEIILPLGQKFTIQNGETILWSPFDDREVTMKEVVARDGGCMLISLCTRKVARLAAW